MDVQPSFNRVIQARTTLSGRLGTRVVDSYSRHPQFGPNDGKAPHSPGNVPDMSFGPDTAAMRRRAAQLDLHADDLRAQAAGLSAAADRVAWLSLAAQSFRERVAAVITALTAAAERVDRAAAILRAHADAVDRTLAVARAGVGAIEHEVTRGLSAAMHLIGG